MRASMLLIAGICSTASINAHKSYQKNIPNGDSVLDENGSAWPGVGHNRRGGGGSRNPFGTDFAAQGHTWTNALCKMDSDGDGLSNGVELGDPQCKWKKGDVPEIQTSISHPGIPATVSTQNGGGGTANTTTNTAGSSSSEDKTVTGAPKWIEAHGFTMTVAWVVIIPLAISFPVLFKHRTDNSIDWFLYHRLLVGIGLTMALIAVSVAIYNTTPPFHFSTTHGRLGLTTLILAFVQLVSGLLRPHKKKPRSRAREIWEYVHWWSGRGVIVLAAATVYTGYADNLSLYNENASAVAVAMLLLMGTWAVLYVVYKLVLSPTKKVAETEGSYSGKVY